MERPHGGGGELECNEVNLLIIIFMNLIAALPVGPVDNSTRLELEGSFTLTKLLCGRPRCTEVFKSVPAKSTQVFHVKMFFQHQLKKNTQDSVLQTVMTVT